MNQSTGAPRRLMQVGLLLLGVVLFAVAYGQAPLYYSNQNQYFVHGLANAGVGTLSEDWLARTIDPTPVFSALVTLTIRFLHPWAFHAYLAVLMAIYAASLMGLFAVVVGEKTAARRWPIFLALLVLVHSGLARWLSYRELALDYPWYMQAGLAGQYVLGAMFQPSTFGVLLVAAVCLFARGRPFLAACAIAGACTLHSTYLLAGALLTCGFLASLAVEGQYRKALTQGAVTLVLVLPITIFTLTTFAPTSPESFTEAQALLADFRIPHHTRPEIWLRGSAAFQLAWMALAVVLAWRTRLFVLLAVPLILLVHLTLAALLTHNDTLALLFPWRISSVLVPVATAVILSRLVALRGLPLDNLPAQLGAAVVIAGLAGCGVWIMAERQAFRTSDDEAPLMEFVKGTARPGDVYFLPVQVPDLLKTVKGAQSSDFKPLAVKKVDSQVIPIDLQRFRLHAGAPIYVDFKSIPYKDTEVIEWRRRLQMAEDVQTLLRLGRVIEALDELRRERVTHLVQPAGARLSAPGLERVYDGEVYQVYRLQAK